MDEDDFRAWLSEYARAWEAADADAAQRLFTDDVTFAPTPFAEPLRGPDAVAEYWRGSGGGGGLGVVATCLAVGTAEGVAHWHASSTDGAATREADGILVVALDRRTRRCTTARQWWHGEDDGKRPLA